MKIEAATTTRTTAVRRRSGVAGPRFADFLDACDTEASVAETAGVEAVAPADALFALQGVDEETYNRQRARQRAEDMLERLDDLRRYLLLGGVPVHRLNQLAALAASYRPQIADPGLHGVLDDIDCRVQVELAKLRR